MVTGQNRGGAHKAAGKEGRSLGWAAEGERPITPAWIKHRESTLKRDRPLWGGARSPARRAPQTRQTAKTRRTKHPQGGLAGTAAGGGGGRGGCERPVSLEGHRARGTGRSLSQTLRSGSKARENPGGQDARRQAPPRLPGENGRFLFRFSFCSFSPPNEARMTFVTRKARTRCVLKYVQFSTR